MKRILMAVALLLNAACMNLKSPAPDAAKPVPPDITVALDGSGDFKTVQEALSSIPRDNKQRIVVYIKDGVYTEQVRLNASFVSLIGQSRKGTRIEFATSDTGQGARGAVFSLNGDDTVIQNLSINNTFGQIGPHEVSLQGGTCDRTVITDCDFLSQGADTISLWDRNRGRYYHARLYVTGAADFICPRGWCYMTDSVIYEVKSGSAGMWHDGSPNQDQKFVIRNTKFDGPDGWRLARHHHDAAIYFLDCTFSKTISDMKPYRVIYPLNGGTPTEADIQNNKEHDPTNIWGDRTYYFNSHKDGGDLPWMANNLDKATGSPKPEQITAKWTFAGTWDPENKVGPKIVSITRADGKFEVKFDESVTVKGKPVLETSDGISTTYTGGSGSDTLAFSGGGEASSIDLNGGAIIATQASATTRAADLSLPSK